ncbi:hypothetical protein P9112_007291 [Eukaryota sp. TZLM1-RC]
MTTLFFYDNADHGLAPSGNTNDPVRRKRLIVESFAGSSIATSIYVEPPLELDFISRIHSKDYIDFLQNVYSSWTENGRIDDFQYKDLNGIVPYCFASPTSGAITRKVPYIFQIGLFSLDTITPIYDYTYSLALHSASLALYAVQQVLSLPPASTGFAACVLPGHHARNSKYAGYCFFNNAVLAATKAVEAGYKVCILDVDVHCGDGIGEIVNGRDDILFVSIHCDPRFEYPFLYGHESFDNCRYYPLLPGVKGDEYVKVVEQVFEEAILPFNSDILILSFGSDTCQGDPDKTDFSGFKLLLPDYFTIGTTIRKLVKDLNVLVLQEGGYKMDMVGPAAVALVDGLSG